MTVAEFIAELQQLPLNHEVFHLDDNCNYHEVYEVYESGVHVYIRLLPLSKMDAR